MRFIFYFLLAALLGMAGYLFWPRSSLLSHFDAVSMAELQVRVWRHAAEKNQEQVFMDFYLILNGQYRLPPLPASTAALSLLQAQRAFAEAADHADEEQALPFLQKSFSIMAETTGATFDPTILAKLELFTWSLARDRSRERQLTAAITEKLALLHGGAARDYQAAATAFAHSARLKAAKNWSAALKAEVIGWQKLRLYLDKLPAAPSAGFSRSSQL